MNLARMSTNGQVTIPVEVRRQLKLNTGDKLIFLCNKDGEIIVKNLNVAAITQTLTARAK
ncbi:MAG: AbrB/MazE/SpoVT family DNA-binding domain-containing protein [Defluviitaleaceae bacterium]|nr:AbrB/MazE/SpoVT family DNA-binding domain-containing protein [Defluviitaleaceae bacterium]